MKKFSKGLLLESFFYFDDISELENHIIDNNAKKWELKILQQ